MEFIPIVLLCILFSLSTKGNVAPSQRPPQLELLVDDASSVFVADGNTRVSADKQGSYSALCSLGRSWSGSQGAASRAARLRFVAARVQPVSQRSCGPAAGPPGAQHCRSYVVSKLRVNGN